MLGFDQLKETPGRYKCSHSPGEWTKPLKGYSNLVIVGFTEGRELRVLLVRCRKCRANLRFERRITEEML
jgi:hypothetical protein